MHDIIWNFMVSSNSLTLRYQRARHTTYSLAIGNQQRKLTHVVYILKSTTITVLVRADA